MDEEIEALQDKLLRSAAKKPATKRAPVGGCGDCGRSAYKVVLEDGICLDAVSCERSQKSRRTRAAKKAASAEGTS